MIVGFADQVLRQRRLVFLKVSVTTGNRLLPSGQLYVSLFPHVGSDADGVAGGLKTKERFLCHPHNCFTSGKDGLSIPV